MQPGSHVARIKCTKIVLGGRRKRWTMGKILRSAAPEKRKETN